MKLTICGNLTVDQFMGPLAAMPSWGTELVVQDFHERTGGALGNSALALAALGVDVKLLSAVGHDARGEGLLRDLARAGVDVSRVIIDPAGPTSVGLCLIRSDGERGFVTFLGALEGLTEDILLSNALALRDDLCFLNGYWLTPGFTPKRTAQALQELRRQGTRFALDTGWDPVGWPTERREGILSLLPHVDVFLPNEMEAEALTGRTDPAEMARSLAGHGPALVVVKLGARGAVICQGGQVRRVTTRPREFADTTGAGDVFDAGFLYGYLQGWPAEQAVQFGHATAALVLGTGQRGFSVAAVQAEMEQQNEASLESKGGQP